ncbi:MAG: M13 family metallopeptidase [Muribaculaceae bacterium]|nr:M13 family metallopeptidase [Muribaculaceae bacterium]
MSSEKLGINKDNLNTNVDPKQDFYEYACGGWIKNNPMPDEFSSYGQFDVLREKARKQVQDLIINLGSEPASKEKGTIAQKISDLYNMGMDEKKLNSEGSEPIKPLLEELKRRLKEDDLTTLLAWLHMGLDGAIFTSGVGPDPADSNMNIMHIGETGLGLGDRDYYLEDNETNRKILEAYEIYVKKLMTLTGYSQEEAQNVWDSVIKLEKKIAEIKMTREQRRNPALRHNIYSVIQLQKDFDFIDWNKYFHLLGVEGMESVNVTSVQFMNALPSLVAQLTPKELEDYLMYSLISNSTGLMSDDFIDANFEMYGKVMSGQKEKKPRWKRAMAIPDSMFGEAVGELYVDKYFPKENKDYMISLVENLRNSLDQHISNLPWMGDETKTKAREKLKSMGVKIGYPDKWKDYSEIEIDPGKTYLENVREASIWFTKDNYSKFNKPVDKSEWHMTPQTVNAYYSPIVNEICFPAGILQPPFFDINADDSINYGAIGVVIGHEMTHGFDDQGRQFDKEGNLTDWWTAEDAEKFNKLADVLVEQFDKVEIAPGVFANGRYTLGENIADQGGLSIALTAYANTDPKETDIEGFSPLQRFFLSYANVWAGSIREEEKLVRTKTDPHSLAKNRVNVTLKNIDAFEETFEIVGGDRMFRPKNERVLIW